MPPRTVARRYADFAALVTATLAARRLPGGPDAVPARARRLLATLGIRLDHEGGPLRVTGPGHGTPPGVGTLVVADHISWLDPLALLACEPVTLVAKREVARWPVVGPLARRVDTCFIDRGSLRALPDTVARVADALRGGRTVAVFPQGTTWCTPAGGTFRRALFQAAIDARAPVRPVTIDFLQHARPSTVAGFLGDDTFLPSLHRVARADDLTLRIRAHRPLYPDANANANANADANTDTDTDTGAGRRALAAAAQAAVFDLVANSRPSRHD